MRAVISRLMGTDRDASQRFRLADPLKIGGVLRDAIQRRCLVNIAAPGLSYMSALLDVDAKRRLFAYDVGPDDLANQQLLTAATLRFSLSIAGVAVRFDGTKARIEQVDGGPAFVAPLPAQMIYMQRREFFRARPTGGRTYLCRGTLADGRRKGLKVYDVSIGGVGLRSAEIAPHTLPLGARIHDATFDFGEFGSVEVQLRVVSYRHIQQGGGPVHHYGCEFVGLGRSEPFIQRLVYAFERERLRRF